jgi:arylsulfatase
MSHLDWVPTLMHAAGVTGLADKLKKGYSAADKQFKVHLDGYDFLPYLTGQEQQAPRNHFVYTSDTGDLVGLRDGDWKIVFAEQRARQFDIWREPYVFLRTPKLFHLRRDPYEQADLGSNTYNEWWAARTPRILHGTAVLTPFLMSFQQFPPRQRPASFTVDQVLEQLFKWDQTQY